MYIGSKVAITHQIAKISFLTPSSETPKPLREGAFFLNKVSKHISGLKRWQVSYHREGHPGHWAATVGRRRGGGAFQTTLLYQLEDI